MSDTELEPACKPDIQREVDMHRYQEARQAGLDHHEASAWAYSQADVGVLRRLVAGGCPPRLIARVVL